MRTSKFLLLLFSFFGFISFCSAQYLHVLDSLTKDVKTTYIVRDSAGQAVVINNSSTTDPGVAAGETVGLDILAGDFVGAGDLMGITAFGLRSRTANDGDFSIWGINETRCGLAGFFQGNTVIDDFLNENVCDLPLEVRFRSDHIFAPGATLPFPPGVVMRPSDVPPLSPPGFVPERSILGGMTIYYKDVADFYAAPTGTTPTELTVNGDGISLIPFFIPEPAAPTFVDVPILGVLNYKEPWGKSADEPDTKGCPECFTDIAFRNQFFTGRDCNSIVPMPANGTISKKMADYNSGILESYRAIEFFDFEVGKKQFFSLIPESLPAYTLNTIGEDLAISGKDWMTHLTLGVKTIDEEQQNLQAENEALKERVAILEAKLDKLAELLGKSAQLEELSASQGKLGQNQPNPFNQQTTINYELPKNATSAQLLISDLQGKVIKSFSLDAASNGSVILDAGTFQSGTYTYTLVVDGKMMETKQMILTK